MAARPHPLREGSSPDHRRPAQRGWGGTAGALSRALGVTRLARLTGLDRTGVEVASAVRPRAHVLQVTNGKGETAREAVTGALLEAAELAAAEHASADAWASAAELAAHHGPAAVVPPRALGHFGFGGLALDDAASAAVRLAWRAGTDLASGQLALVPAHAVHVPPAGGPWLGPALVRWTSNGMGASPDAASALLHALLEVVERDRVARALPHGFTPGALRRRMLERQRLAAAAPRTAALVERIERCGLRVFLLDLTEPEVGFGLRIAPRPGAARGRGRSLGLGRSRGPRPGPGPRPGRGRHAADLGLPTAAALLLDVEGGPVPVAAGYACRLSRDDALRAAVLEAAQSRATEIHGAREDVAVSDRRAAEALRALLERSRPARDPRALPDLDAGSPPRAARLVTARLVEAGIRPVAVELEGPAPVAVVKVIAPGLLLSDLL